jgi:hypothetical protein
MFLNNISHGKPEALCFSSLMHKGISSYLFFETGKSLIPDFLAHMGFSEIASCI